MFPCQFQLSQLLQNETLGLSRSSGLVWTSWSQGYGCFLCVWIYVHTYRCHDVNVHVCLFSWLTRYVCSRAWLCASPPPVTACMSCPQPFQYECVSVLIPLTPIEQGQDTRGNHMALCISDLCSDLRSSLTLKCSETSFKEDLLLCVWN